VVPSDGISRDRSKSASKKMKFSRKQQGKWMERYEIGKKCWRYEKRKVGRE
jgi:hypothetical protein